MAISSDYITLQRQVADELGNRTDLLAPLPDSGLVLSPVQNAIQSAIAKWEREPFWFNELYSQGAFNTVAGQEFYTVADVPAFVTLTRIPSVRVTVNNNRYTLTARTWQYLEDIAANPQEQTSLPFDYAYFAQTMRIYPIPSEAVPVTLMANTRLDPLVNDGDANAWTEDGYDLIRSEAKLMLSRDVLQDDDMEQRAMRAIYGGNGTRGYLADLKAESSRRTGQGHIRPSNF